MIKVNKNLTSVSVSVFVPLQILDMRHLESQVLHEETASEQGSIVSGPIESGRRAVAPPHAGAANTEASPMYSFNLSFEELSTVGLDESARHGNVPWMVNTGRFRFSGS